MRSWTRPWWSPRDPAGVRAVTGDESSLDDADAFKAATAGLPSDVSALGYLNLGGLIYTWGAGGPGGESGLSDVRTGAPQAAGAWCRCPRLLRRAGDRRPPGRGSGGRRLRGRSVRLRGRDAITASDTLGPHEGREPARERVPVHLGIRHRGAPRQDLRSDLRRRARRGDVRRPGGRVACECLVNTGLVVVAGEISHADVRRHPEDRPREPAPDRLRPAPSTASTATPAP